MNMNKSDLINAVTKKRDGNKKYIVKSVLEDIFDEIQSALMRGEKVSIRGFGTFEVKEFKAHPAVHPETKERIMVPSFQNVVFHPGEELTRSVREE